MKLLLQVLFAQGWLWRDRFPEVFAEAKRERQKIGWWVVIPPLFVVLSARELVEGNWSTGVPLAVAAGGLVLWRANPLQIDRRAGSKELWISVSWASASVVAISLLILLVMAVLTGAWVLLVIAIAGLYSYGTGWLHGIQSNYLMFADPANNAWRLNGQETTQKGLIAPRLHLLADTYWRLPRQILFAMRGQHYAE